MSTARDIEKYVLLASDASNFQLQQQANTYLNNWVLANDDKTLADTLVEIVRLTQREVVLFYTLTSFSRLTETSLTQRTVFRHEIFSQLFKSPSWSPTYLRTKVGVLLARFIQLDFPHAWPSAFDDLQASQMLQNAPDILLRTLVALMDDFGKDETEINTKIKDNLRGYNVQSNKITKYCNSQQSMSGRLIETVRSMLDQALEETTKGADDQIQIYVVLSLQVLKGFMSWVDISLVLEERILRLIFAALARGSAVENMNSTDVGVVAIECMKELIDRGMEDHQKITILRHTRTLENLDAHVDLITVDASPIDIVLEVAKFINRTGLEIFPILISAQQQQIQVVGTTPDDIITLNNQLIDLFFRCFSYDDIDVSGAVIPLAVSLVASASSIDQQQQQQIKCEQQENFLSKLLAITYEQMRYPPDFQYDYEDEDEAEEEIYRGELRKLNQKFIRTDSGLCLRILSTILSRLPLPLSGAPTCDIEVAVSLIYHYCEGIRPPPGMMVVMRDEKFRNLLIGLHLSDIVEHPHREVLILYYETGVRYYPLLKKRPDLLQKMLEAMTGTRGLRNENSRVRSRCCYLLLRLIKSVGSKKNENNKSNKASILRPYVETAVTGIQSLLKNNSVQLRFEDTLNLFETIGLLLGKNGMSPSEQGQYLTKVVTPHVQNIKNLLNERQRYNKKDSDSDANGENLANSIAAIAYLSKGFKHPPLEVQTILMETLQIAFAVVEAVPTNSEVRNKTYIFIQRLILCLEDKVLSIMPRLLSLLIQYCTAEDILDAAQLMNQLCIKFRKNAAFTLDCNLLSFLQKCHHLSNTISGDKNILEHQEDNGHTAPHLRTEQLSIQKLSYAVLNHVVSNNVSEILLSPTNISSLEAILQSMSEGAISVEDPLMKKTCLTFFRQLLDQWVTTENTQANDRSNPILYPPPDHVVQGYIQYICGTLIPGMMQVFLQRNVNFNINDANNFRLLFEFSTILEILKTRLPEDVVDQTILRLGLPPELIEGIRSAGTHKEFEISLKDLIQKNNQLQGPTR